MKKTDTNLPVGILGFRQPYGGIDHVEQWQELSGSNDATIEIEELVKPPVRRSRVVLSKRSGLEASKQRAGRL